MLLRAPAEPHPTLLLEDLPQKPVDLRGGRALQPSHGALEDVLLVRTSSPASRSCTTSQTPYRGGRLARTIGAALELAPRKCPLTPSRKSRS